MCAWVEQRVSAGIYTLLLGKAMSALYIAAAAASGIPGAFNLVDRRPC